MSRRRRSGRHSKHASATSRGRPGSTSSAFGAASAFERLLVRLELGAPGRWVVKGGMALEMRLGDRARSTRDLDLGAP